MEKECIISVLLFQTSEANTFNGIVLVYWLLLLHLILFNHTVWAMPNT